MPEAEIKTLQRIYTAVQQGNIEGLAESLTHDVEWRLPESLPWGGTHHGHLGVQAVAETYQEHIEGLWADPDEYFDADDGVVVVTGRILGHSRQSGKEFETPFAHVWRLTEGVPSSLHAYFDAAPILSALGIAGEADG